MQKVEKSGFFTRLLPHSKPTIFVFIGLLFSIVQSAAYPLLALFCMKLTYAGLRVNSNQRHEYNDKAWDRVILYSCLLCGVALMSFTASYMYKVMYGIISENMTKAVRKSLYTSIIYKHIGWFD